MNSSTRTVLKGSLVFLLVVHASAGKADQHSALEDIATTADRICNIVSISGSASQARVQGDVTAQLKGLAAKLAKAGVSGAGEMSEDQYQNVLRQDLATTLKNNTACRLKVFEDLYQRLLPQSPDSQAKTGATVPAIPLIAEKAGALEGEWQGAATCSNGQSFSVTFVVSRQAGRTAVGRYSWEGSNSGNATATLSPDPRSTNQTAYLLIPSGSTTFKFALTKTDANVLDGLSMGQEACLMHLEK